MENISIALLCSLLGAGISYLTLQKNNRRDIRADTREETATRTKLDYIATAVDEIRLDNKARDREVKDMAARLVKVEESCKSAHKRIDSWEEK